MRASALSLAVCVLLAYGGSRAADPAPIWKVDLASPKRLRTSIEWVGFSPDSRTIAVRTEWNAGNSTFTEQSSLFSWNWADKKEHFQLETGRVPVLNTPTSAFASNTKLLTVGDRGLFSWDNKTGEMSEIPGGRLPGRNTIWVTQDGTAFFQANIFPFENPELSIRHELLLHRGTLPLPKAGQRAQTLEAKMSPLEKGDGFQKIAISPDGTRLAAVFEPEKQGKERLAVCQIEAGEKLVLKVIARSDAPHPGRIDALVFAPDGRTLATSGNDGSLKLWEVGAPAVKWEPRATLLVDKQIIRTIAFRPDGKLLALGLNHKTDSKLGLVNATDGKLLGEIPIANQNVNALAFSPDGRLLATGGFIGLLQVWDAAAILKGAMPR